MPPPAQTQETISFGPFELIINERQVTRNGGGLRLGARDYDIPVTLLPRSNEIINKSELIATVWPSVASRNGSSEGGSGQRKATHQILRPAFDRFTEAFEAADLVAAERLLIDLS